MKTRVEAAILGAGIWSGPILPGFAAALGTALEAWSHTWVVTGQAAGSGVAGTVRGALTLVPNPAAYSTVPLGLTGPVATQLSILTNLGVAAGVTGTIYQGVCPTVGSGVEASRVTASPDLLVGLLVPALISAWGQEGATAGLIASWLAPAITLHLRGAVGVGVVVGSVSPTPTAGVSLSRV